MIDVRYTLRCDGCQRYLAWECQLIAEYDEEAPLRELAAEKGWTRDEGCLDRCAACVKQESECPVKAA